MISNLKMKTKLIIGALMLFNIAFFINAKAQEAKVGVGAKVPPGAEAYLDGSRAMLDAKWIYWNGPRLKGKPPIQWSIVNDPVDKGTVVNSNDPNSVGGLY